MSPKIRFAIKVTRWILAIVDVVIFPAKRPTKPGQGSDHARAVARFSTLAFAVLGIMQAWHELRRGEARPARKRVVKPQRARTRGRTRGKRKRQY